MIETHTRSASLATNSPYYHTSIQSPAANKTRRPSLSNPMSWLTHSKGSASTSSLASPVSSKHHQLPQISEPTLTNLDASVPSPRLGALGSGATVVRTPAEALSLAAQRQKQFENIRRPVGALQVSVANAFPPMLREDEEEMSPMSPASAPSLLNPSTASMIGVEDTGPTPRNSSVGSTHGSAVGSGSSSRERVHVTQSSVPASPRSSPLGSSLKMRNSGSNYHAPYTHNPHPSLVSAISSAPAQPPFSALLLSHLPQNLHKLDPSRVLVMVETSQGAHKSEKTTLATVLGRGEGSHLAEYLKNVIAETAVPEPPVDTKQTVPGTPSTDGEGNGDSTSLYSPRSEFHDSDDEDDGNAFDAIFQNQLGLAPSTGSAPGLSTSAKPKKRADSTQVVHVFLDRPSAPYAHILSYLRSGILPYAVRLPHASSPLFCSRLETILELRDEAVYIGLNELQKLCTDELAGAASSSAGERLSVHTLCDPTEASSINAQLHGGHLHTQSNASLHPHQHPPTHMRTFSSAKPPPSGPLPYPPPEPMLSPGLAGFQFPQRDQNDVQVQSHQQVPPHVIPPVQGRERQGSDGSLPAPIRNALHMRSKSRDPYGTPRAVAAASGVKPTENYF